MPGTFDDLTGATALSPTGGDHDSTRDFKDYNGRSSWSRNNSSSGGGGQHSRSGSALDRHSESSESLDNQSTTSSGTCSKMQDFGGSTEYIPTRSTKTAPKVAYNPMQFVKTGPTKLAATAQEQLKKVEEIKKVQKEKKRDEAEDWQSNLEGWKSSRRKRQEHVIERVTEVKRMEQEEALKASEAAAKRLIGIREKRGKLSALYSVEDNDEIEFDSSSASEANVEDGGNRKQPESPGREVDEEEVFHQTEEEPKKNRGRPSPEYTYDKAIEDYVKYSTTALSSSSSSSGGGNNKPEILNNSDDSSAQRKEELKKPEKTQGITQSEVVQKRRSAFEASKTTTTNAKSADESTANRGEFSSSFKSRLSSFDRPPEAAPTKVTPDRDPNFRDKLANFKTAEPKVASNPPPAPVSVVPEEEPKPDFKAKLAAFRQVEASSAAAPPPPPVVVNNIPKVAPVQPKEDMVKVNNKGPSQPALPSTAPPPPPPPVVEEEEEEDEIPEEPIYANTAGGVGLNPVEEELAYQPATLDHPKEPSESSDCTEDEGIRSLSPHGTPSPTSPVQTEQKNDGKGENDPSTVKWPPSETVWDGRWTAPVVEALVLDAGPAPAPPSEKPPPPPPQEDEDPPPLSPQVVTRRSGSTSSGPSSDGHHRSELRKRRSDFLGFDVNAVEDDARELAEAIPPPPDLTSILRSTAPSNYRTTPSVGHQQKKEDEERRLAAQERAIIETLEKEEKERVRRINSGSALLNQSHDGSECNEMTAEIDQLALEWAADAMGHQAVSAGWKPSVHNKFQESFPSPPPPEEPQVLPQTVQPRHSMPSRGLGPIQVTVPEQPQISSPPGRPSIVTKDPAIIPDELPSPPKPSRLSAAPKPRLHDGEAWMAKRKVASEGPSAAGQTRKEPKDVSRHWLIQEAEQRRIDAMQERNYSPSSVTSSSTGGGTGRSSLTLPFAPSSGGVVVEQPASSSSPMSQHQWMSRSSSSNSMDKMMPELVRLQGGGPSPSSTSSGPQHHGGMMTGGLNPSASSRSASSLGSSPTSRPLYANQEEILEYADFTGAPHTAPPVWQVRSLVSSGSMDQLSTISPPSRPMKNVNQQHSKSQSILPGTMSAAIHHPSQQHPQALYQNSAPLGWRSSNGHHSNTLPLAETKEPIAPLPQSVIQTLTQRMSQRSNTLPANNNMMSANYGDYMNIQEVVQQQQSAASRAGPQVPSQRPANYRHPSSSSSVAIPGQQQQQQTNNNDRMLSVSGKKKCSLCQEELGRGAAMIIESLRLFYHINCFRCCVCGIALGNGTAGTDVRVRNNNLHCHDCYSNDDGLKFSKV